MKKITLSFCMLLATGSIWAQSMTPKDSQFAANAIQAGMLEAKLGELTISRAASDEVKNLGQRMVVDHTKANDELKALAVSKNITLPTTLTNEGQMFYDSLAKIKGSGFDRAYTRRMVADHEKAVALFKEESNAGSDADVKSWASITLPVLEHHLMMSKDAYVKATGK